MNFLVPFAEGVEPLEAVTIVDVLRRADMEVTTVSLTDSVSVCAAYRMTLTADALWSAMDLDTFGAIVLPGGGKGTENLLADNRVLRAVQRFAETGRIVAALCAAPTVLAAAGILEGRRATCFPTCAHLLGESYDDVPVVADSTIITSQGPGTAMLFALALVQQIKGDEAAQKVAARLLTTFE
ncbi:MAG: DJ-1/PfpI family protein [Kiritimatiellaeota bacterium]|nr:DJ-1/PfpI family protein [Kiritimatiellota bacterium]